MDLTDINASIQKIADSVKSTKPKQNSISVGDAWYLWDILTMKYDSMEVANILSGFINDKDLKIVVASALKVAERTINEMENLILEYAIPLPPRPPKSADSTINLESITDKYIFNRVLELFKQILTIQVNGFNNSYSPRVVSLFKKFIIEEMTVIDNLTIYGEAKCYLDPLPMYMP
ncbi:MAG: hypothetical protein RO469_15130 [Thermincola sp.]|jgi:hypothetical protein|nr:hypothetical protein [Thermincola sp.]MDT3702295.1 hypothetical protein [Thermincola sp.]